MRQLHCPECGHPFSAFGEGHGTHTRCPNCNELVSVLGTARRRGTASLLPGAQFLRGRSYGWYSTLMKGRQG